MPTYSALLDEFRALSIARARENAPVAKQQKELVERLTGSLERCPPGQKKAGCEGADRERETIGKQLAELSKAAVGRHRAGDGGAPAHGGGGEGAARLPGVHHAAQRPARRDRPLRARGSATRASRSSRAFPDYVALADPKPLSVAEAQSLLKGDEVLVVILVGSERSFVWAVTRERAEWAEIDASNDTLAEHVRILRNGLDPLAQRPRKARPAAAPASRAASTCSARTSSTSWCSAPSPASSKASVI